MLDDLPSIPQAARDFRDGRYSPRDLLERCITAIETLEPTLHAWVQIDLDAARREADRQGKLLDAGHDLGSLQGIPLGIKDLIDMSGWPTRAGSPLRTNHVAASDAPLVERLRTAGAVLVGKTVTTEFACFDPPPTRNPWRLDRTQAVPAAAARWRSRPHVLRRHWVANRRVNRTPRQLLRSGWIQADFRPHRINGSDAGQSPFGPRRPHRPHRRRSDSSVRRTRLDQQSAFQSLARRGDERTPGGPLGCLSRVSSDAAYARCDRGLRSGASYDFARAASPLPRACYPPSSRRYTVDTVISWRSRPRKSIKLTSLVTILLRPSCRALIREGLELAVLATNHY